MSIREKVEELKRAFKDQYGVEIHVDISIFNVEENLPDAAVEQIASDLKTQFGTTDFRLHHNEHSSWFRGYDGLAEFSVHYAHKKEASQTEAAQ